VGKASQALKDVRIKMGQGIAGWWRSTARPWWCRTQERHTVFLKGGRETKTETQSIVAVPVRFPTLAWVIELINVPGFSRAIAASPKALEQLRSRDRIPPPDAIDQFDDPRQVSRNLTAPNDRLRLVLVFLVHL